MSVKARIITWTIEIFIEALTLAGLLIVLAHANRGPVIQDIFAVGISVLIYFCMSGYLVTTLIARIIWKRKWMLYYSLFAPILFLAHFEFLNRIVASGLMDSRSRVIFRLGGACVTFIATLTLSLALKKGKRLVEDAN